MEVDPSSRGTKMNELVKEIPHVLIEVKGIELEVNTKIVDWKWSIMERHLPPLPHYSKINLRLIYLLTEEEWINPIPKLLFPRTLLRSFD